MKSTSFLFLSLLPVLVFSSCEEITIGTTPEYEVSIYPGECLSSFHLGYNSHKQQNLAGDVPSLCIGFKLFWDVEYEHPHSHIFYGKPSKITYDLFDKDSKKVKKAYSKVFDNYNAEVKPHNYEGVTSTVYYCGGLDMIADKDFAGIPAGKNLESAIIPFSVSPKVYGLTPVPTIDVPESYIPLGKGVAIYFPLEGHELVDGEEVTFHLEIPVKVGLMLTLLRDRLTDPDAQMQYRDEVLTCDFTINHGLH